MSKFNCYLCASDEGMLLDIFGDAGKAFRGYIETCLSVKVKLSDVPSTKICHKCAYELESCEKFLAKYRRFSESVQEGAASKIRGLCCLCGDTPKKLRLLRVDQANSRKNLLDKLQHVSLKDRNSLKENIRTFSVCLDCRYHLDVLSDLKTIHRESVKKLRNVNENGQKLLDLPKVKTSVVRRKTTYISEPILTETSSYESEASSTSMSSSNSLTMPLKRKRVRSVKKPERTEGTSYALFRQCEECGTQVESGIDMYRYHRSGQTVCKDCWLTMDPEKVLNAKRKRLGSSYAESGTKLCAVFLKDVLSNPSKYSNAYRVEKDKDGNKTFLITDESSESEEKDRARPKRLRPRATDLSSPAALETIPETRKAVKRPSAKESKMEQQRVKRGRPRRSDESVETSPVHVKTTRARNGIAVKADSTIKTRSRRSSSESTTASTSLALETEKKNPLSGRTTARTAKNAASKKLSADEKSLESGSSSNESRAFVEKAKTILDKKKEIITVTKNKNQRAARRARSNSFTGSTVVMIPDTEHVDGNSSEDSSMPLNFRKAKGTAKMSKTRGKNAKSDSELDKPYTCSICQLGCKNKLVGKAHELTHEKQPKVELRRVVVAAATATPETNVRETPHVSLISKEEEKEEEEKGGSDDEKNGNAATAENPEQPMPATEKSESENIATPEEPVSEEKTESSPVREEPEDERTMKQNLDDETKENKEETQVPLEKETETTEEAAKDESFVQETKTDRNETDENAANENKENDNSEEKLGKEKDDEASDRVEESSAESKEPCQVEIEPPEVPTPRQDEPEEMMDVISTKETEETTQNDGNARTVEAAEPMEVTETEEEEKNVEEKTGPSVEHVENRPEQASCEKDAKATTEAEKEETSEQGTEVEIAFAKTASETEETPEVLEVVEEAAKDEEKENSKENDEEKDEEESSDNHKEEEEEEETAEKLTERDEEEKEAVKSNKVEDERMENPEEMLDSSRDEKEKDEQVCLVFEEGKENEEPIQQSKKEDEEKKEEHNEIKRIPEADEASTESSFAATETLREVFDLASAEVNKRLENENADKDKCATAETLENISIEIQSGGSDMPSLGLEAASTEKS